MSIDNSPKEVLGYHISFQAYFHCSFEVGGVCPDDIKDIASKASKRCSMKMVSRQRAKDPASVYEIGERVLVKYPTQGSRILQKRKIIPA